MLNHPFPTKQLVNAVIQMDFDTKIKPYTVPGTNILKHDMIASLKHTLNISNDPKFINSLRFNSSMRWKNVDNLEDQNDYGTIEGAYYGYKTFEMICNISIVPLYVPVFMDKITLVFGKNAVLDHFRLQKKYQNLVHVDLLNVVKNTKKQYLIDEQDAEALDKDMNATSLYLKRNLPNRSITDNVKKLHYDLVKHLKGLKRNTKECRVGTIDDCGNEHPDARKTVIMSNYECFKGVCEPRIECQSSRDCHTTTLTSRFNDTSLSMCYRNFCTLKHTTENAPCESDIECAGKGTKYGLYCINKHCKKLRNRGETCLADYECRPELFCYSDNKLGDSSKTGICFPRKKEGDTCDRDDCGPSPSWRCGADGTCTKNSGNAGSFCVDDADCSDELTCQQSTCRIHMGGIGCRVLSGALDIDNANNKHCLETFVCEKDVCVGDLGASCDPHKKNQCKFGLECNKMRNVCERKQCNSFADCPKDFLCSKVKVDDNPFEKTDDINDRSPKISVESSVIHEDKKKIKACTRNVGMRCSQPEDCTHPLATCHRGWCLANNGMACEKDSECMPPALICFSHQCQLDPINRTNYHKCDAYAKELCVTDCMEKAGLNDVVGADGRKKTIFYDTKPSYGHETYNETRSNYCGLCCLDCFCDNSEDHWESFGRTLFDNFLHLDKGSDGDGEKAEATTPVAEEEVNEMFKPGDVNNSEPIKFEKLADSAEKGEERKKRILGRKKEENDLLGR